MPLSLMAREAISFAGIIPSHGARFAPMRCGLRPAGPCPQVASGSILSDTAEAIGRLIRQMGEEARWAICGAFG